MCARGSVGATSPARVSRRPHKTILTRDLDLHTSKRRRQLRIDAREGARAAAVRQGRVPEGPRRPREARVPYPGGRARAGPREVVAWRAGVLSAMRGHRAIGHAGPFVPARETPSPYGRPVASDRPFVKQAYRARTKRSRQQRSPNPLAGSWANHLRLPISPASNGGLRPGVLRMARKPPALIHLRLRLAACRLKGD